MVKHGRFTILSLFLFCLLGLSFAPADAQTIRYVNRTDAACGGHAPCYTTIQGAINSVGPGDVIRIQSGVYPEQISIAGKNNFQGADRPNRYQADQLRILDR
jgi:hypothetical protein